MEDQEGTGEVSPQDEFVSDDFTDEDLQATATPPATTEEKAEVEPSPPEFVQVTKADFDKLMAAAARIDEINATTEKQRDQVFGKLGGIERTLQQLQQSQPVSDEDMAQLREAYPDLADLSLFQKLRAGADVSGMQERVEAAVAEANERTRRAFETRLLTRDHPDWKQVVGVPEKAGDPIPDTEYRRWLSAQPEDYRNQVGSVWDADVVGESIRRFKEQAKAAAKADGERRARDAAAEQRRSRLAAAVPAKGDAVPAVADTDPFLAGYTSG